MEQDIGECATRRRAFFRDPERSVQDTEATHPHRRKSDIDNVVFTCCILHNILHTVDGVDTLEPNTK